MSAKLLIVALICAVAYAQAQGTIVRVSSSNADCSSPSPFNSTIVSGECTSVDASSSAQYFDATNVYSVSFYGAGCNGTIRSITQVPTGCGTMMFGQRIVTVGTSAAFPTGFTAGSFPDGFSVTTIYANTSAVDGKASVCTAGNGIVSYQTASNSAYCNVRQPSLMVSTPSSTQGACSSDGTISGVVIFSDNTCGTPVAGSTTPIQACNVGLTTASSSSCGSAPTISSSVPVTGFTTYTNDGCTLPAAATSTFIGATCFDSQTLTCGTVNGTDNVVTYNSWMPAAGNNGQCTGTNVYSQVVEADRCVPVIGSTTQWRKYTCTGGDNPSGGSASTVSVSIVATLFAAAAAVFAGRSL